MSHEFATELEISGTLKWLKAARNVVVNVEWLEACISWLKSCNTASQDLNMLRDDVYEQWLMSDLGESGCSCLPDEISTLPMTNISGIVPLQVNSIVNIGASAYSQVKKLENELVLSNIDENETQNWQPKPCRMLKLELTDGTTTVNGMEYKPMKKLNTDILPGTKILIKDVLCRRDMMFLTDENTEVLGGQVEHLEGNSQLNILKNLVRKAKERKESNNNGSFPAQLLKWTRQANDGGIQDVPAGTRQDNNEDIQDAMEWARQNNQDVQDMFGWSRWTRDNEDFLDLLNEDDDDFLEELDEPENKGNYH